VGEEAFQMLIDVLSGKMTKNEALGYFGSMDVWCMGPVI
jgi:altronate dehydratase large subunit